ncbi:MAG: hypothetical protein JG781_27 [Peptococcaceae bacterium]|jgi:hypothetical protein|nr:hypothetical protein [Peptococcaceae bacterium]
MAGSWESERSRLTIAYNLSGALEAVKKGALIVLVDVISMSTTLEAVTEAGAAGIWGACPSPKTSGNTLVNPFRIGQLAAREAKNKGAEVVIITEPRVGSCEERKANAADVIRGVENEGLPVGEIWPNLGAETAKFTHWHNKVAVAVTDAGGVIYDAVYQLGGMITTATVARTLGMKGVEPALKGVERAIAMAKKSPITLVAASSNALEDVLAVHYLAQLFIARGYCQFVD